MSSLRASFPAAVVTVTGRGQALALTVEDEGQGVHDEVFILDAAINPTNYARDWVQHLNATRAADAPRRTLVQAVPVALTEAGTHVFARQPAGDAKGELFRCSGCGLVVHGRASARLPQGGPSDGHAPYALQPSYAETRRYYTPCTGDRP